MSGATSASDEPSAVADEPLSLFKVPLGPARFYPSPRGPGMSPRGAGMSPASKNSPRNWQPPSPGFPGSSPKYCMILSEPVSPMPATPKSIHDLAEPMEEEAMDQTSTEPSSQVESKGGKDANDQSIVPDGDCVDDLCYDSIADVEPDDGLFSNILEVVPTPSVADLDAAEDNSPKDNTDVSQDIAKQLENVLRRQNSKGSQESIQSEVKVDTKSVLIKSLSNRLMLETGIDIQATVVPEESSIDIPTLALVNFEDEDDEYLKVCKVGTGSTNALPVFNKAVIPDSGKSSCVFHVAQDISIDMPLAPRNLEIMERGSNKIFLTADSDQIEAHNMRTKPAYTNPTISRGKRKKPPKLTFGRGWFTWKDWRVDSDLMANFSSYLSELTRKWDCTPVSALSEEKKENPRDQHVQDIIDFFVQVFVKAYQLKNVYKLEMDDCIDFIRGKYTLDNEKFNQVSKEVLRGGLIKPGNISLDMILSKETIQRLDNPFQPPGKFIIPLPATVAAEMASVVKKASIIKEEPVDFEDVPSVRMEHYEPTHKPSTVKLEPGYVIDSVQQNYGASVAVLDSVQPISSNRVGQGNKCLQFFFENPMDGTKIGFNPVYVQNDDDVNYVVALVNEKAGDYKYKLGLISKPTIYYAEAVRARSKLDPTVVRYIEQCFTKKGMKEHRPDYKKRNYPKRAKKGSIQLSAIKKEDLTLAAANSLEDEQDISEEEFYDDVVALPNPSQAKQSHNYVTDDDNSKRSLEERVFGGRLPKVKIGERSFMKHIKSKNERGGQLEDTIREAVDIILDPQDKSNPGKQRNQANSLKLSSLIKSAKRKPRPRRTSSSSSSSCSDDDFFNDKETFFRSKEEANVRMSERLKAKYSHPKPEDEIDSPKRQDSKLEVDAELASVSPKTKTEVSPTRKVTFMNVSDDDLREMARSLSRAESRSSRPGSQTEVRPGSENSRPGSRLINKSRKHFGFTIDSISDPERDSPVLTPRRRHQEKTAKSVGAKSPIGVKPIPEKSSQVVASLSDNVNSIPASALPLATALNNFEQMNVRKSKVKKINKLLEKQKKKAEKHEKKKLLGYGQKKITSTEKSSEKVKSQIKKAQVTREESELLASLLKDAEKAVVESKSEDSAVVGGLDGTSKEHVGVSKDSNNMISEFEEAQGMADTQVHQDFDQILSSF